MPSGATLTPANPHPKGLISVRQNLMSSTIDLTDEEDTRQRANRNAGLAHNSQPPALVALQNKARALVANQNKATAQVQQIGNNRIIQKIGKLTIYYFHLRRKRAHLFVILYVFAEYLCKI